MIRSSIRVLLLGFLVLAASLGAGAQSVTGTLSGIVWDESGDPVKEAEVILEGPSIQGTWKSRTDASGTYSIFQIPPSEDLTVRAVSPDFGQSDTFRLRIKAGVVTTLNMTLSRVEATEVEVFGTPISTRQATVPTTLPELEARTVPFIGEGSDRSYQSLLYFNPTATHSRLAGNPAMGGATGVENVYLIDGLFTNDPVLGTFGVSLNSIFFKEMGSEIYGVEAQNPTSTGGFFNLITRSGSNEFHGDLFAWTTDASLMARENSNDFEVTEEETWSAVDYGFALGGPIKKDRLWFFVAANPYTKTEERKGANIIRNVESGRMRDLPYDYENRTRTTTFLGKLSWRISDSHRIELVTFGDPSNRKLNEGPSPTVYPEARRSRRETGGLNVGLRWFATFGHRLFGEAFLATTSRKDDLTPWLSDEAGYGIPLVVSQDWSPETAISPGFGRFAHDTRKSRQIGLKATGLLDTQFGFHEITGGLEHHGFYWDRFSDYTGGAFIEVSDLAGPNPLDPGDYGTRITTSLTDPDFRGKGGYSAAFLQDRWSPLEDLTFTFGLRWEQNRVESLDGNSLRLNSLSPRLGITWDFTGTDRGKLYASAGRYHQRVPLYLSQALDAGQGSTREILTAGSDPIRYTYSQNPALVLPGIRNQSQDEFTLGIQYELFPDFVVGARAVYRELNKLLETVGYWNSAAESIDLIVMNPGHQRTAILDSWRGVLPDYAPLPTPKRRYKALEITFEKRFTDKWFLQGNYTLSRLSGNTAAGHDRSLGKVPEPNDTPEWDIPSAAWIRNRYGILPTDRTHQAKLLGGVQFDFGLLLGGSIRFDTGRPRNKLAPWPKKEIGYGTLFVSPRGTDGRLPSALTLNLHAEYAVKIKGSSLALYMDVINLMNDQTAFVLEEDYYEKRSFWSDPSVISPDYGKTKKNTAPRAIGIGLRWSF